MSKEITVPDIGDFKNVEVIDVLVKPGDTVAVETPLITIETEKATMDVPSPIGGVVKTVALRKGDRVSAGSLVITLEERAAEPEAGKPAKTEQASAPEADVPFTDTLVRDQKAPGGQAAASAASAAPTPTPTTAKTVAEDKPNAKYDFDVVVLGAGPGGYTAAFRAADLGMKTALIERWPQLGGVCLNVGCIPSKALLHAAKVISEVEEMAHHGISFGAPQIDIDKLRGWKQKVVARLTGGLTTLSKQRKIEVVRGEGKLVSAHEIDVTDVEFKTGAAVASNPDPARAPSPAGTRRISFAHCIIAAGSESVKLPGVPEDPRIIDSTGALELDLPKTLLVVGGGIIGLEMATVYDALGVKVSVVELTEGLMPGCDRDLVRPLEKRIAARYEKILVKTKVSKIEALSEGIRVTFESKDALTLNPLAEQGRSNAASAGSAGAAPQAGEGKSAEAVSKAAPEPQLYDKVLIAVGRSPNGKRIAAEAAGVLVNDRGFIPVDRQMRTNVPHIFAIGDIAGQPMLAHKASHEGKLAAEVAHGEKRAFDARVIPSVAYTDPEVAWVGVTETDAKSKGIAYEKATFPWAASGRSLALGRDEGLTKLIFDPETRRVIGAGIVGPNAGDLIAEVGLAIEMGCDAADIGLTIHAHPTLSETIAFAAEAFEGTLTDLYIPKRK